MTNRVGNSPTLRAALPSPPPVTLPHIEWEPHRPGPHTCPYNDSSSPTHLLVSLISFLVPNLQTRPCAPSLSSTSHLTLPLPTCTELLFSSCLVAPLAVLISRWSRPYRAHRPLPLKDVTAPFHSARITMCSQTVRQTHLPYVQLLTNKTVTKRYVHRTHCLCRCHSHYPPTKPYRRKLKRN
jgi:hypothetical protein